MNLFRISICNGAFAFAVVLATASNAFAAKKHCYDYGNFKGYCLTHTRVTNDPDPNNVKRETQELGSDIQFGYDDRFYFKNESRCGSLGSNLVKQIMSKSGYYRIDVVDVYTEKKIIHNDITKITKTEFYDNDIFLFKDTSTQTFFQIIQESVCVKEEKHKYNKTEFDKRMSWYLLNTTKPSNKILIKDPTKACSVGDC